MGLRDRFPARPPAKISSNNLLSKGITAENVCVGAPNKNTHTPTNQ